MTTTQAATTNGGIFASLTVVIILYAVLGAVTIWILLMLSRHWRHADSEIPVPYGLPPSVAAEGSAGQVES